MRIELTESEYEAIHSDRDKLVIAKGYDVSSIEKVIAVHESYMIVEKYAFQT